MTHQLHLIRTRSVWDTSSVFDECTMVRVFADPAGYEALADALSRAVHGATAIATTPGAHSMRGLVLKPDDTPGRRVKFLERAAYLDGKTPEMELMVMATRNGLSWLRDLVRAHPNRQRGPHQWLDLDPHDGFDVNEIAPGSVSVRLHGAIVEWERAGLEEYAEMVLDNATWKLPKDHFVSPEPYVVPEITGVGTFRW